MVPGSATHVGRLRAEYSATAFGIGTGAPRLSWQIVTTDESWQSDSYEIELRRHGQPAERAVVDSAEQVLVPWPFAPLESRSRVEVRVRVSSGDRWTQPSEPLPIEVGLLHPDDWSAQLISPSTLGGLADGAPVVFTTADIQDAPTKARLYVTAHGLYELTINGSRVGEDLLTPGWTAYQQRLRYQTYDVTGLLHHGENTIAGLLGNGWFRGQLVSPGNRSSYGDRLALLAQLELTFADGTTRIVGTDASWRACSSSILFDDLYDGQRRDLRLSNDPGGKSSEPVIVCEPPAHQLVAPTGPPVRVTERVQPVALIVSPSGATIVDFGQNLVGWVRLVVRGGSVGSQVVVRHAEVLEDGELGTRPLRSAKATSTYILSGATEEVLVPTFTFHGFRYAEIVGVDDLDRGDVEALVLGSDLRRSGWLTTSDPLVNRLHENVVWGMRGNFLDLPTDCPQRDERLGWTGDIQVFTPTASFLFDTAGFLGSWLEDLAAEQKPDGGVPYVIPDVLHAPDAAAAGWSDAATIVPSSLFSAYADRAMLARQYPSMRAWVDKITSLASTKGLWDTGFQFGDWLDPTAPPDDPGNAQADEYVIATAHYARSARLVADAATTLGDTDDAATYDALANRILDAFNREYVTPAGRVLSDCQTVYAVALCWDLIQDSAARHGAGERLSALVRDSGYTVGTGFIGTPLILDALCLTGHPELAYRMLLKQSCPSWMYAVTMGATTIWERWDSMLPDGTINPGGMTSFNHYAYGAVADWMHRRIAGICPASPGYRRVNVAPIVTGQLTSASARYDCAYGTIATAWTLEDGWLHLTVELPYGVTGSVFVPGQETVSEIGRGRHEFSTRVPTS